MNDVFQARLRALVAKLGTQAAAAKALGVVRSRMTGALQPENKYRLDVEPCLRLALHDGADPIDVLREAGHEEAAELLEAIYGPISAERPTVTQRAVLTDLLALDDADRARFLGLIKSFAQRKRAAKR